MEPPASEAASLQTPVAGVGEGETEAYSMDALLFLRLSRSAWLGPCLVPEAGLVGLVV